MLAKLKRSTLMQEEQRKREKTQKDVIQRDWRGRKRNFLRHQWNAGDEPFCTQCSAICVLVFFFFFFALHMCDYSVSLDVVGALPASILLPSLHPQLCHSFIMGKVYLPIPLIWTWSSVLFKWMAMRARVPVGTLSLASKGLIDCSLCLCHYVGKYMFQAARFVQEGWRLVQLTWPSGLTVPSYSPSLLGTHLNKSTLGTCPSQAQPRPDGSLHLHSAWWMINGCYPKPLRFQGACYKLITQ